MDPAANAEVVPRPAATIIAMRRRGDPFEILMVRRAPSASFMGGAHVFPGGAVDPGDFAPETAARVRWSGPAEELPWRSAALRELAEEAGILVTVGGALPLDDVPVYESLNGTGHLLDADALVYLSNWVTPRGLPKRFDTRFYLLEVPIDSAVRSDRIEVFDPVWVTPRRALAAAAAGEWLIEVPTRAQLETLATSGGIEAALAEARLRIPDRVEPRLVMDRDGVWSVLLPGDPGFDGAGP